jgi:hypothetical protein
MSIELVDKIDQAQKSNKRYRKVGGLNDLFLHDDDASISSHSTLGDEYVGLELEAIMEKKEKRRFFKIMLIVICLGIVIAVAVVFHRRGENSRSNLKGNNGNSSDDRSQTHDDDKRIKTSGSHQSNQDQNGDDNDNMDESTMSPTDPFKTIIWPTAAPLPKFGVCKPIFHFGNQSNRIHHLTDLVIVPEDNDEDDRWEYTVSSMDIDEHASIIAIGLSDYSRDTDYEFGMVRVFAFSCVTKLYQQLGQDLLGEKEGEQFGYAVSSSKDGKVMAVSAPQKDYDGGHGFVDVFFLDENVWSKIGQRIEELDFEDDYYGLGAAIDLSDDGKTLALVGVKNETCYLTLVMEFDSNSDKWVLKGKNLPLSFTSDNEMFEFNPYVSLNDAGDELNIVLPDEGLMKYHFEFEKNIWIETKDINAPVFEDINGVQTWINDVEFDESGDILSSAAYRYATNASGAVQELRVFDFSSDPFRVVYNKTVDLVEIGLDTDVSDDGQVVAVVLSQYDSDDNSYWEYDNVGAMAIISKNENGIWKVLGAGTDSEYMGVPGGKVFLSGDGSLAAVGSDTKIAIYAISLNHFISNETTTTDGHDAPDITVLINSTVETLPNASSGSFFQVCAPFPDGKAGHVSDIDSLPKLEDQHTLSISLSGNGSFIAVGIDSWESEDRGMVRVFAWNCNLNMYSLWGQDLFGEKKYDGFGQSVDLSQDGKTLVVGANQPEPGNAGYVDIYIFGTNGLWNLEKRFNEVNSEVQDVGREVRISADGSTVAIHGSIVDKEDGKFTELSSYIRIKEKKSNEWVNKGDVLMGSIPYDEFGSHVKLSFSANGKTLGVTGSYNTFMAKMYTFDSTKSNWTESIIPPIKRVHGDYDSFDEDCEEYFDGSDISLSDDGLSVAIAGLHWGTSSPFVRVLKLESGKNWTMSHDPIDYDDEDYTASSIEMSGDAKTIVVGINSHCDDKVEQGVMLVSQADSSDNGWKRLGEVEGRDDKDFLGSRVSISSDGRLAAASSRRGYISLFLV